jgi:L-amino acid N-acyltransferase YncA
MIRIRLATASDYEAIWEIFREVVAAGDTFANEPGASREEALEDWIERPQATYVGELEGRVAGVYFLKPNQRGLGSHICNAGYMVAGFARGRGLGRAMGEHSLAQARALGYRAMQFNLVVSTNRPAVELWRRLGFEITGTLPGAFRHSRLGFVDAYVMFRQLDTS